MENNKSLFNLVSTQRYFHLVAFKVDTVYSISSFWKDCGFPIGKDNNKSHEHIDFKIEQKRIISHIPYHGGNKDYSINESGSPPFNYDIMVIEIKNLKTLIFAFPFKSLAKTVIGNLIENIKLLTKGNFIKTDINKLIKIKHNENYAEKDFSSYFIEDNFSSHFIGLELIITGMTDLSSVNLDGDNPLQSSLYKNVFLKLISENKANLNNCTLKCETLSKDEINIPKTKTNVHIDLFGNYKMYLHLSGKNIFTIPLLFNLLNKYDCIKYTSLNPIINLKDE